MDGNPHCAEYGLVPILVWEAPNGPTSGNTATIQVVSSNQFNWTSVVPVYAVIVKGGPGANVYTYDGATLGSGLRSPQQSNGAYHDISRIELCGRDRGTPTSTPTATATPGTPATASPTSTPTQTPGVTPLPPRAGTGLTTGGDARLLIIAGALALILASIASILHRSR